jgi:tetratricopeptide (TPR) repeat protein
MSEANKAVFVSYASQDTEAALRICEALRAAGVEVWFDRNELVGGDQWDQKIRKQIKECALLIPVISAATQARTEGYFRLEWRLADQRTHLMAKGRPFLLPVVIDDTRDGDAQVPDSFTEVQWTRLRQGYGGQALDGASVAAFCERVKKLLSGEVAPISGRHSDVEAKPNASQSAAHPQRRNQRRWLAAGILTAATIAALGVWKPWGNGEASPKLVAGATRTGADDQPAGSLSNQTPEESQARKLVAKAWEQLNTTALGRAELEMADRLCRQAAELDPNDADVWAVWSQVDTWCYYSNLERTPERREGASSKAARALKIAPESYEARLAQACFLVREEPHSKSIFADEAERHLRRLLEERPDEPRVLFALGVLLRNGLRYDEGAQVFDLLARQPAFAATALSEKGYLRQFQGHLQEAGECAEQSIAIEPFYGNLALKAAVAISWYGDLEQARLAVEAMPSVSLLEDFGAGAAFSVYWRRREPEKMLRLLRALPQEWLSSNNFSGPKRYYVGMAHEMAGRMDAARAEWRIAFEQLNVRLQSEPSVFVWHLMKARLHVWLGSKSEAAVHFQLAHDFAQGDGQKSTVDLSRKILLGDFDGVITMLQQAMNEGWNSATAAALRTNPTYDPIRADPRFQALVARAEADPRLSPNARPSAATTRRNVDEKSVAVLAFTNLSDDKDNEYFADGISEELLNVLAMVPSRKVSARAAAFFKKTTP